MFHDQVAQIHKRVKTADSAGGSVVTHTPVLLDDDETPVDWLCQVGTKAGMQLRRPVGEMPDFDFLVLGDPIDPDIHRFAEGDRLKIVDGSNTGLSLEVTVNVGDPTHVQLGCRQVDF